MPGGQPQKRQTSFADLYGNESASEATDVLHEGAGRFLPTFELLLSGALPPPTLEAAREKFNLLAKPPALVGTEHELRAPFGAGVLFML